MKSIIIANWKMQLDLKGAKELAMAFKGISEKDKEVVICPSFASLGEVGNILKKGSVKLGAQNCFWEVKGAYTGEVSSWELKDAGCEYVIIGHSERRQYLKETDEMVHEKVRAALSAGLTPIICVGETFEQRQQGARDYILIHQTTKALEGIKVDKNQKVIVAYEPVWVIGSGQAVAPEDAASASQVIGQTLIDLYSGDLANNNFSVIYGGSVDSRNIKSFVQTGVIQGFLVGGASLKKDEFIDLIKNI